MCMEMGPYFWQKRKRQAGRVQMAHPQLLASGRLLTYDKSFRALVGKGKGA